MLSAKWKSDVSSKLFRGWAGFLWIFVVGIWKILFYRCKAGVSLFSREAFLNKRIGISISSFCFIVARDLCRNRGKQRIKKLLIFISSANIKVKNTECVEIFLFFWFAKAKDRAQEFSWAAWVESDIGGERHRRRVTWAESDISIFSHVRTWPQ